MGWESRIRACRAHRGQELQEVRMPTEVDRESFVRHPAQLGR